MFGLSSPAGDQGFPAALSARVAYRLTPVGLDIDMSAETDAPTVVNLVHHTYWNLAGTGTVLDHEVAIEADHYLPVDATQIPTGVVVPVAGTAMDFTISKPVGRDLEDVPGEQEGYDHCYVLRHRARLAPAAVVHDPSSGRLMEVATTQPGVQFYTGNNLTGFEPSGGYGRHGGLCIETQHFPDSPNQPQFPSTVLSPGEEYAHVTVHRFSAA